MKRTALVLIPCALFAQSFEVASVRLHEKRGGTIGLATSGPRLTAEAKTLQSLVMYAYDLKSYQVPLSPALMPFGDDFYDITARAEGDATPDTADFRRMMQSLLADRFQLKVHREIRELPIYALVVEKTGPKFSESAPGADPAVHYAAAGRNYDVIMPKATMEDVVRAIENSIVDRPVLDRTGLTGTYRIHMLYTPDTPPNRRNPDPDDISIFTAIRALGLRLEPRKASTEVLVVEHAEKPSAN
jgi:uncharacterized protein (TIGR03435 family)